MIEKIKFQLIDFFSKHSFITFGMVILIMLTIMSGASILATALGYTVGASILSIFDKVL